MEEDEEDDWPLFDARGMRGPNYSPEVASEPELSPSASACEVAAAAASTLGLAGPVVLAKPRRPRPHRPDGEVYGRVFGAPGYRTAEQHEASVCNSYKDHPPIRLQSDFDSAFFAFKWPVPPSRLTFGGE